MSVDSPTVEAMDMALGTVVEVDRGSLPFALIHGEALVAAAVWALSEAEVLPVDLPITWEAIAESGEAYVLHDALCPMTPPAFIAECVETALARDVVVIAVRPITDTVKLVEDDVVAGTVDRAGLVEIVSPIVLPPTVVSSLREAPITDFAALAADLAQRFPVITVIAPGVVGGGRTRPRGAHDSVINRCAARTSSGQVILRLRVVLGTARTTTSSPSAAAVSVA